MNKPVDVVVAGAGPVGLLLAIELTLGGARVLVLERLAAPGTGMKALSIGPLGSEALQRRGMAAAVDAEEACSLAAMEQAGMAMRARASRFKGHFAGLPLARTEARDQPERCLRFVEQRQVEAMLADRARELGVEVRRGCAVTGLAQQADGVDVAWTSPAGEHHGRCSYLVGCDGGRSPVRKMAGFAFPGTPPTLTMYQAIVGIDHPERLGVGWRRMPGGVLSYGPSPRRLFMVDFSGPPEDRQAPVTREEIETVLRRVSGMELRVDTLEGAGRWTDNTRLVDSYRRGRVLLAGDAAHVHAPFGGQGLSLGLVDAANLGWKLAAVVRGDLPDGLPNGLPNGLLDTYDAERRPVAEAVLANTLAQLALLRPDPQTGAMRDIVAALMRFDDVNRFFGDMMSGLSSRYDLGAEADDVGRLIGDRRVGRGGGLALHDVMQDGMGVLLDAGADGAASALAAATRQVRSVAIDAGPSMLIRPDGCIAWVGAHGTDGLQDALGRWFGVAGEAGAADQSPGQARSAVRITA